jgi:benzoylformate decarboxylase
MGGLYTAGIAQTPLLVLIGGQDRRFLHTQPILWGPLEKMAGSICKNVFSLDTAEDAASTIEQALRALLTPPFSPVALICPPDLLEEQFESKAERIEPPPVVALKAENARAYARALMKAQRPALIAAEDVHWNNASGALEKLALALAAPVYAAPYTAALPIDSASPCYAGYLPPSFSQISERLANHDLLFFIGGTGLRTTLYSEPKLPQTKLWIGNNPRARCVDGEFELSAVADTASALTAIAAAVDINRPAIKPQRPQISLPDADAAIFHPSRAVHALLDALADAIWFDESGLSTSDVRQWMNLPAGEYLINGSGGIGWGLAASVGAAIGNPDRQVVAIIGDGSALYASEALWTAAHEGATLLLVVLSNRRYATLNEAASRLTGKPLDLFTIEPPVIDFSGLATLYDWNYARAANETELSAFLTTVKGKVKTNTLLELKLDPSVKPVTASRHF